MNKWIVGVGTLLAIFLLYENKRLHPNIPNGQLNDVYTFIDALDHASMNMIAFDASQFYI